MPQLLQILTISSSPVLLTVWLLTNTVVPGPYVDKPFYLKPLSSIAT